MVDPTPAEPQGRPEQAGDRPVTLSELVEALRSRNIYDLDEVANRLEGK